MNVTVKLFGPQAMLAGRDAVIVTLPDEAVACGELRQALAEAEPRLAPSLPNSRFAVNHEYVREAHRVTATDEVALIGMISGG